MFVIEILQYPQPGYSDPIFSWDCPLCETPLPLLKRNLDLYFVYRSAVAHMIALHGALEKCLCMEVKDGRDPS